MRFVAINSYVKLRPMFNSLLYGTSNNRDLRWRSLKFKFRFIGSMGDTHHVRKLNPRKTSDTQKTCCWSSLKRYTLNNATHMIFPFDHNVYVYYTVLLNVIQREMISMPINCKGRKRKSYQEKEKSINIKLLKKKIQIYRDIYYILDFKIDKYKNHLN